MSDIVKHLIDLVKDGTTSIGFKTALGISIIGIIFLSDNIIGFSYNHHLNNKLEQLKSIQSIKVVYKNDSIRMNDIVSLEKEIFDRNHYTKVLSGLFSYNLNGTKKLVSNYERSIYWMILSSNYSLIIGFFILLYLPLRGSVHRTLANLAGWFAMLVIMCFIMAFLTWIAYLIPLLCGRSYFNYLLNVVLHIPVAYLIYWFLRKD